MAAVRLAVEGRLVVIKKQQGMASGYDCSACSCPAGFQSLSVAPVTFGIMPAVYQDMGSTGRYQSCNGTSTYYYDLTTASSWNSDNTPVIAMDGSVHYRADGMSPGTANVTGSYTDCSQYDTNPDFSCPCISTRTLSGVGGGTVQVPAILKAVSSQTFSYCSGTGCLLQIKYQVLDGSGSPINIAGLQIAESVNGTHTGNCTGTLTDNGTWNTDSTGTMTGPDNWWWCCDAGCNDTYTFDQTFTVNGYNVQIVDGSYTGSHNVVTIQCNNGQGSCPSVVPTP